MKKQDIVELEVKKLKFYSHRDEESFVLWLEKNKAFVSHQLVGGVLYICFDRNLIDEEELRDLIALFDRYKISMRQLKAFEKKEFTSWLRDPKMFWSKRIFGKSLSS